MRHRNITTFALHLETMENLIKGVRESLNVEEAKDYWHIIPPEHSDQSVIRRLIQIRQEALQLLKKLNYRG